MRIPLSLLLLFLTPFVSIFTSVSAQCPNAQRSLLLQLKDTLKFDPSISTKLANWNQTTDCCQWGGITCDHVGHIIGLDLNSESISANKNFQTSFQKLFLIPTLQTIDLSNNRLLEGSLLEFPQNGSLKNLVLSYTKFSGKIPDSIGNLRMLSRVELRVCSFGGPIPNSISKLAYLVYLDFSVNHFTGPFPSFGLSRNLTLLNFYNNRFTGKIPSSHFDGLNNLEFLHLGNNFLSGDFPVSLFSLPSLKLVDFSNNHFSGQINEYPKASSSLVEVLDLSGNELEGPIPKFFFELRGLTSLTLASNNFNGIVELSEFKKLEKIYNLDLSYNNLVVKASVSSSSDTSLPQFGTLMLASCKLQQLPDLKNQAKLMMLDLSKNQIGGEIPNWIWGLGGGQLRFLNLSNNLFSDIQVPYNFKRHDYVDLHSNRLHGQILKLPTSAAYIDYSSNFFHGIIPQTIGNSTGLRGVNFSHNALTGRIPTTVGSLKNLQSLDLSVNKLSGGIPIQLANLSNLSFLNLSYNELVGRIPRGHQFATFTRASFEGNKGLCGAPLNTSCNKK